MQTQVLAKWGNSLGVRIPIVIANQINLTKGTNVSLTVVDGNLVIQPVQRRKYTLDELLEGMTSFNCHPEVDMGKPVGNESW